MKAADCAYKNDGSIHRWCLLRAGSDLTCVAGYEIFELKFIENDKPLSMMCCKEKEPETTIAPSTTTTLKPKDGATTEPRNE
jgi:hypothetical protein